MTTFEKITADDVQIGDVIGRTKKDLGRVVAINEGTVARRFALVTAADRQRTRWNGEAYVLPAGSDIGNIRPRRTAQLWRRTD